MGIKVSIDDLRIAADWCQSYDDDTRDDDPTELAIKRVGAWLNEQAAAREREAAIRAATKEHGVSRKLAAAAIDKLLENAK